VSPNAPGSQGYSLYSYVANNPATWTDPSGHLVPTPVPPGALSLIKSIVGAALGLSVWCSQPTLLCNAGSAAATRTIFYWFALLFVIVVAWAWYGAGASDVGELPAGDELGAADETHPSPVPLPVPGGGGLEEWVELGP